MGVPLAFQPAQSKSPRKHAMSMWKQRQWENVSSQCQVCGAAIAQLLPTLGQQGQPLTCARKSLQCPQNLHLDISGQDARLHRP